MKVIVSTKTLPEIKVPETLNERELVTLIIELGIESRPRNEKLAVLRALGLIEPQQTPVNNLPLEKWLSNTVVAAKQERADDRED